MLKFIGYVSVILLIALMGLFLLLFGVSIFETFETINNRVYKRELDVVQIVGAILVVAMVVIFTLPMYLLIAGILWSPFATVITVWNVSKNRGHSMDLVRHFVLGFVRSGLFFVPWIYLMARIQHKPVAGISLMHNFVMGFWLLLMFGGYAPYFIGDLLMKVPLSEWGEFAHLIVTFIIIISLGIFFWVKTARSLARKHTAGNLADISLTPFALFFVWFVMFIPFWIIVANARS